MKHPVKIQINRNVPLGYSWTRYKPLDKFLLETDSIIKTEAQLAYYIYKKHGPGRYQLLAWQKGYEGFWLFWLGDIMDNGFVRDLNKNKALDKLKQSLNKAQTYEEKAEVEDEMQFEKELFEAEKTTKRRGPLGIKKARSGVINAYEEF